MMATRLAAALISAVMCLTPGAHATDLTPIPPAPVERAVPMMINLAPLADWGTQQPFLDRMKVARPWIGHLPRRWGGLEHDDLAARGLLDADGWPRSLPRDLASIGTLIMTDLPEEARTLAGRYVLRFEGSGIVEVSGRAQNVRYGRNRVSFDFEPGDGWVEVKIQRSDPRGTGNYVRNITVVREDRLEMFDHGAVFNPDFLQMLRGFSGLRFMDWMRTNNATLSDWEARPKPADYTYTRQGIPLEVITDLANELGADAWITLPHKADDAYFRKAAELFLARLNPDLRTYVEYSNEVWNWQFEQAAYADAQARARWNTESQWQQFYGMRAAQMAKIWRAVYADAPERLVTVLSTQAGWLQLEEQLLYAPLWQAEDPANPAPYTLFDAYAITGYMYGGIGREEKADTVRGWIAQSRARALETGQALGLKDEALRAHVSDTAYDHAFELAAAELMDGRVTGSPKGSLTDLLERIVDYHARVATAHDLELIMYEGGTHIVGLGPILDDPELSAFFQAFNYSDHMGVAYSHLIAGWAARTDGVFNHYNDVTKSSRWGSWGAKRFYGDDNARWQTIRAFRDGPDG